MSDRVAARDAFLARSGWGSASLSPLAGDASTRSYQRLKADTREGTREAVLMDAPPGPDGPPVDGKRAYSAIAHLAEDMRPFAAIGRHLKSLGLSAPEIFAQDLDQGFLIIEDLGDGLFAREIENGVSEVTLYGAAADALAVLHEHGVPDALSCGPDEARPHHVPPFDDDAMMIEVSLLPEWFGRLTTGAPFAGAAREAFDAAWRDVWPVARSAGSDVLLLRDYHSPNLLWLPQREGVANIGIIDFQDAMVGPPAYDLVSALQDARRTVDPQTERAVLERYINARRSAPGFDQSAFLASYAAMGAQRNTKIIGIFARLWLRDNKPQYLAHVPRLADYLARDLSHPALKGVADWYAEYLPLDTLRTPIDPSKTDRP